MCRLLGIVASELTQFGLCLETAPRSLSTLSHEHPDGWGIAIHVPRAGWRLHKGTARAAEDRRFRRIAMRSRGRVLVAHVRQKTVGPTHLKNTHPFARAGWVFAHNGTIEECAMLRAGCSAERLAQIKGDTDSEALFAYLLTRLDARDLTRLAHPDAREEATRVLADVTAELRHKQIGAFNFLLSDGATTFVHRFGRTLFLLERNPGDLVRQRPDETEWSTIAARWTRGRRAVLVASERLTDEPWREVPHESFFRVDRDPFPEIAGKDASSPPLASLAS
jgi:predicted glutamine amidotransferase